MTSPGHEGLCYAVPPPPSTDSGPERPTTPSQGEGEGVDSAHDQASGPAVPTEEWQLRVQPTHRGRHRHRLPALVPQADEHLEGADQLHLKRAADGSEH